MQLLPARWRTGLIMLLQGLAIVGRLIAKQGAEICQLRPLSFTSRSQ